jgi:hypothetical protein
VRARCCCLVFGSNLGNLGVPAPWSLGDSPASLRPSSLVWSGVDDLVQRTRRPFFVGNSVVKTGSR